MHLSVVISTLARPDHIRRALASLRRQTFDNFEVLVVAGPDAGVTRRVVQTEPDVRLIDCPLANLSVSRNLGWRAAAGELVAFMDDDAIAMPRWLEDVSGAFLDPRVAAAGGFVRDHTGVRHQWQFLTIDRLCNPREMRAGDAVGPFVSDGPLPGDGSRYKYPAGTNMVFRRSALLQADGFDEAYAYAADDADLCLRLYDLGFRIAHVPYAEVIHYYAPSHQRDSSYVPRTLRDTVRSFTYFKLRHGPKQYSSGAVINSIEEYLERTRSWVRGLRSEDRITDDHASRLLDDIEKGSREAFTRRLFSRRPMEISSAVELPRKFQPFGVLRSARQRLRLCFVSQELPSAPSGGIGVWVWTLARQLASLGHDITIVSSTSGHATYEFVEGCWVDRTPTFDFTERYDPDLSSLPWRVRNNAYRVLDAVQRLEAREPFDMVFAPIWDVEGIGLLRTRRGLNAVTLHTPLKAVIRTSPGWRPNEAYLRRDAEPIFAAESELAARADLVLANSRGIVDEINQLYGVRIPEECLHIVPHGIDHLELPSVSKRGPSTFKRVLFVGRFEGRKGIDLLLAAAPEILTRHPDALLDLCGDANIPMSDGRTYLDAFRERWRGASWLERVIVRGWVSPDELLEAYASCDVFVAPSRFESFGLIYLEAMRFAKPVIALDIGGAREMIRNGENGMLVKGEDPPSLAKAIVKLLSDLALRERLGQAGRKIFLARFTADAMARAVEEIVSRRVS